MRSFILSFLQLNDGSINSYFEFQKIIYVFDRDEKKVSYANLLI